MFFERSFISRKFFGNMKIFWQKRWCTAYGKPKWTVYEFWYFDTNFQRRECHWNLSNIFVWCRKIYKVSTSCNVELKLTVFQIFKFFCQKSYLKVPVNHLFFPLWKLYTSDFKCIFNRKGSSVIFLYNGLTVIHTMLYRKFSGKKYRKSLWIQNRKWRFQLYMRTLNAKICCFWNKRRKQTMKQSKIKLTPRLPPSKIACGGLELHLKHSTPSQ